MDPELVSSSSLAFVSLYCLKVRCLSCVWASFSIVSYATLASYGILGALKALERLKSSFHTPEIIKDMGKYVRMFGDAFVLSYGAAELWQRNRIRMEIVWFQLISPLVPVILYLADMKMDTVLEYAIQGSIFSFAAASIFCEPFHGFLTAGLFAAYMYYFKDKTISDQISPDDLKNYVLCLVALFMLYTLE